MDPGGDEQIDFGDEEYGGNQKMQYHGGGAIPALAEDEMINEDDEYDDLYNDVNVGEGFLQMQQQRSETPLAPGGVGIGGFQAARTSVPDRRAEAAATQGVNISGSATEGKYASSSIRFPDQKSGVTSDVAVPPAADASQKGRVPEPIHSSQVGNLGYQGSMPMAVPQKVGVESFDMTGKIAGEPVSSLNQVAGGSRVSPQIQTNHMSSSGNATVIRPVVTQNQVRPVVENGNTMLFVGELHWWTTDADLESVLTQYGKVKEIKFFDERASGKSKGYCQVEFFDPAAAASCKEGMHGHVFNGRACVVALATPQTIKHMASSYMNKTQVQAQSQLQGRRPTNDGAGRGNGTNYASGDTGRNIGRGGWTGRGGQGMSNKGPVGVPGRGRGAIGAKNMIGNAPGGGNGVSGGAYGQGLGGPAFGVPHAGLMPPQAMMAPGFDPTYMGRGASYGGFSGPAFPGMMPPFPAVNPMGLAGVAPHVNPAFFGRGMAANGMGMMGTAGMDGPHAGMWTDSSMGWGGEEHGRRTRESSYGGEDNASEYGYGEASHDKVVRSSAASREKERGSERDWSGSSERRHRDEREHDRDGYARDHKYREEKVSYRGYRPKERDPSYEDDWDKGQPSRSRSRSRAVPEEHRRSRSRDADYGKRRRLPSE